MAIDLQDKITKMNYERTTGGPFPPILTRSAPPAVDAISITRAVFPRVLKNLVEELTREVGDHMSWSLRVSSEDARTLSLTIEIQPRFQHG